MHPVGPLDDQSVGSGEESMPPPAMTSGLMLRGTLGIGGERRVRNASPPSPFRPKNLEPLPVIRDMQEMR